MIYETWVSKSADSDLRVAGKHQRAILTWNPFKMELLNPFIWSRRNSITRSDIIQHNKSSVSSKSLKVCWHWEWVKLMGSYGEECVNKPPCPPSREVCGSILDCKYISYPLNPSVQCHADKMNGGERNKVFYEGGPQHSSATPRYSPSLLTLSRTWSLYYHKVHLHNLL